MRRQEQSSLATARQRGMQGRGAPCKFNTAGGLLYISANHSRDGLGSPRFMYDVSDHRAWHRGEGLGDVEQG